MGGGIRLLVLGVVVAALGVATARAAASGQLPGTTTADTTTTAASTTGTTTSTTAATTTTSTTSTTTSLTTTTTTSTQPTATLALKSADRRHATGSSSSRKHPRKQSKKHQQLPLRAPPDYPLAPYPLLADGGLTAAAQKNAAVSIAVRYLGIRYLWGGGEPTIGFDCSGLVQFVFGRLGVYLPHNAAAQYYSPDAVWVRPSRLQPGDLVFFTGADGTRREPGHVGIYVADGYFIDAPHTGSYVRVDSLDAGSFANTYVGAKRIVDAPLHARTLALATWDGSGPYVHRQLTSATSGVSSHLVAAVPTATRAAAPRRYALWATLGLVGVLLLLAGGVTYGRRRSAPAPDPSAATAD